MPLRARPQPNGSFADLDSLVEHLGEGATIAFGNPLAIGKRLPKRRSKGPTPAQINRLLLDPVKGGGDHPALLPASFFSNQ
jgi:hypothetical protein